jgi:hypothetical protein
MPPQGLLAGMPRRASPSSVGRGPTEFRRATRLPSCRPQCGAQRRPSGGTARSAGRRRSCRRSRRRSQDRPSRPARPPAFRSCAGLNLKVDVVEHHQWAERFAEPERSQRRRRESGHLDPCPTDSSVAPPTPPSRGRRALLAGSRGQDLACFFMSQSCRADAGSRSSPRSRRRRRWFA